MTGRLAEEAGKRGSVRYLYAIIKQMRLALLAGTLVPAVPTFLMLWLR